MTLEDYERARRADYEAFGAIVAAILEAVIAAAGGFRLQQVKSRAKTVQSLRKKLADRGEAQKKDLVGSDEIETAIKDLAGCRAVFYTNADVSRFLSSGLIEENFDVLEVKLHHPRRDTDDAAELYTSNHYLVRLRPERLALAEYASFADMRCEIQIQTILNHAWAEMAHDTIYKEPELDGFGSRALELIKARMAKIARKYLVPAGYEFAKVAADFDRLLKGGELFKSEALEAIVTAQNNNERADALTTFAENVLPLYDNLEAEFPDILNRLITAVELARDMPSTPIETPYGEIAAKTVATITRQVAKLIGDYRNVDPAAALEALIHLYRGAKGDDERAALEKAAKRIADLNLSVWRAAGPAIQMEVLARADTLIEEGQSLFPILVAILAPLLGSELEGSHNKGSAVVLERGPIPGTDEVRAMRRRATGLLKMLFPVARNDDERKSVLAALRSGANPPVGAGYLPEQAAMLLESAADYIEFLAEQEPDLSWELLQAEEKSVLRQFRINRGIQAALLALPEIPELQARIEAGIAAFRAAVAADAEYGFYRLLVGFGGVFPPSWDQPDFGHKEEKLYRAAETEKLVATLSAENEATWFDRVMRYAATPSNDLMTFPVFADFLAMTGEHKPDIALLWLDRLAEPLARFGSHLLRGLQKTRPEALNQWMRTAIGRGRWLSEIAWFEGKAEPFDETILSEVMARAIAEDDRRAVHIGMHVAGQRFPAHPGTLIDKVFWPGLMHMQVQDDMSWVGAGWGTWHYPELVSSLDAEQAKTLLASILPFPDLDDGADAIVGAIASTWPGIALDYLGNRIALAHSDDRPADFDAIPFTVDDSLTAAFAPHPALLLAKVRRWYEGDPGNFAYDGGRLITASFPDIGETLSPLLDALIAGNREDRLYVLAILNAYEGNPVVQPYLREMVSRLDEGDELLAHVSHALGETGAVVMGEMGFVERHERKLALLRTWLEDENGKVRAFAAKEIAMLEQRIAAETRLAEASRAARRLQFGEDVEE